MVAIDQVAPIKERRIKHNSLLDKSSKKFKKTGLHIGKELYNAARDNVHKLIFNKIYFF